MGETTGPVDNLEPTAERNVPDASGVDRPTDGSADDGSPTDDGAGRGREP